MNFSYHSFLNPHVRNHNFAEIVGVALITSSIFVAKSAAAFSSLRIWLLMGKCSLVPQFLLLLSCEDQSRIKFDGSGTFHFRVAWCCGLE
ncbi:hypothetical protein CMV_002728, partial [Castanea mollissima]